MRFVEGALDPRIDERGETHIQAYFWEGAVRTTFNPDIKYW